MVLFKNLRLRDCVLFLSHILMLAVPPTEYTGPVFAGKGCRRGVHQKHRLDIRVCTPIDSKAVFRQLKLYMHLITPDRHSIQELLLWKVLVSCFYIEDGMQPESHELVRSFL